MTVKDKASIEDQKNIMDILRNLERPPDMQGEAVREQDLIVAGCFHNIAEPEECIRELLAAGIVYRAEGESGDVIKRTEAGNDIHSGRVYTSMTVCLSILDVHTPVLLRT